MDIRNWPIDRIMQLPDHCFGRHWPIGLEFTAVNANDIFDIAEMALPEMTVIWEVYFLTVGGVGTASFCQLALGDHLPATLAEFNEMELVFPGLDAPVGGRGALISNWGDGMKFSRIRHALATAGRRFVGRWNLVAYAPTHAQMVIVVSSIPTEVPDWLCSV